MYNLCLLDPSTSLDDFKFALAAGALRYNYVEGYSALHIAVLRPYAREAITLLLRNHVDCNSVETTYGGTPLHTMLANENSEGAIYFIEETEKAGQRINYQLQDHEGKTPLMLATMIMSPKLVQTILAKDKDSFKTPLDHNGRVPLHFAYAFGQKEIVKMLLNAQYSSVSTRDKQNKQPWEYRYAPRGEIAQMLRSIHIDPDRDVAALKNGIMLDEKTALLVPDSTVKRFGLKASSIKSPIAQKNSGQSELLQCKTNKDFFAQSGECPLNFSPQELVYIRKQLRNCSGISIVDACLAGQDTFCFQIDPAFYDAKNKVWRDNKTQMILDTSSQAVS
ncbi:MAG: ankyrin repeat domain-containing protein [Gammaproteobacteria bacterium]|nr:ankyrin repeat domain-containing protein [Gammaproteobacteria bacterium]